LGHWTEAVQIVRVAPIVVEPSPHGITPSSQLGRHVAWPELNPHVGDSRSMKAQHLGSGCTHMHCSGSGGPQLASASVAEASADASTSDASALGLVVVPQPSANARRAAHALTSSEPII